MFKNVYFEFWERGFTMQNMANIFEICDFQTRMNFPFCSIHDLEFVRNVFMKEDRRTLYFEDDFNFKLILHERDFVPGVTIHANIVDAIKHSRRMIMILSRYPYPNIPYFFRCTY